MKKIFYSILNAVLVIVGMQASAQQNSEQNRQVSGYSSVVSAVPSTIHIKLDGTESVRIVGQEGLIDDIETVVEKESLIIRYKKYEDRYKERTHTDIYVSAKQLKSLVNNSAGSMKVEGTITNNKFSAVQSGAGSIKIDGLVKSDDFRAVLSGSGSISTDMKTQNLHATISGSGSLNLSGNADKADLILSGAGILNGRKLNTESTSALLSGTGYVTVAANKSINAMLSGTGGVYYTGNAVVSSTASGLGRVRKESN